MKRYEVWLDESDTENPWVVMECSLHAFDSSHCNRREVTRYAFQNTAQGYVDQFNGVT